MREEEEIIIYFKRELQVVKHKLWDSREDDRDDNGSAADILLCSVTVKSKAEYEDTRQRCDFKNIQSTKRIDRFRFTEESVVNKKFEGNR